MDCKTAQLKIMPYIHREMDDREMEEFLEHIQTCKACSEELEVYFTIYYALERLDQDEQGSYNIQEMLRQDLKLAKEHLQKQNVMDFYRRFFLALVSLALAIVIVTGIQAVLAGGVEKTTLYVMLGGEEDYDDEVLEAIDAPSVLLENIEPETNRKMQLIITVPETEPMEELEDA